MSSTSKRAKKDSIGRATTMGISENIITALEDAVESLLLHPLKELQGAQKYPKGVEEWEKLCTSKARRK